MRRLAVAVVNAAARFANHLLETRVDPVVTRWSNELGDADEVGR